MILSVKYLGMIAEKTGKDAEELSVEVSSIKELAQHIINKYPGINECNYKIAVNHSLNCSEALKEGDEVAFLPPFAGG